VAARFTTADRVGGDGELESSFVGKLPFNGNGNGNVYAATASGSSRPT